MNKYAIYCDSLEDEQLLKDWLKKEFDDEFYQKDELFKLQKTFNFPNFKTHEGYKRGYHIGRDDNYTKINIKDFLKEYYKMNKTELLGLPIIKGEKHHLEAFVKDCIQLGYRMSTYSNVTTSGIIKLNTNTDEEAYKDFGFKILFNLGCCGNYTGEPTLSIKEFQLPSQWSEAVDFMKENMDRWKKIQEENKQPEFKVGDYVVILDTGFMFDSSNTRCKDVKQISFMGKHDTIYPSRNIILFTDNSSGQNEYHQERHYRKATPQEIEEYLNKPKIFKMTSSSGDFELEVSKKGIYYRPEDSWVDPTSIEKMLLSAIPVYGKFNSRLPLHTYTMEFETVKVGCKSGCSVKAWKEVYDYYKSLQK